MESLYFVGIAVLGLFAFIICILIFRFFNFWLRARLANAPVGLFKMFGMSLRKVPVGLIVDNRITSVKAGIDIPSDPLEAPVRAFRRRAMPSRMNTEMQPYVPCRDKLPPRTAPLQLRR